MNYLIEIEPFDPVTGRADTLRYSTCQFVTEPDDTPANVAFDPRIADPGNYERYLFGRGRTRGESDVAAGEVRLVNADRNLDGFLDLAFDGRPIRIYGLERDAGWADRETLFVGLMERVTFEGRLMSIVIRDRLQVLRKALQTVRFRGTTINGTIAEAEGNADLKDVFVPELYGSPRLITPVVADAFNNVFRIARRVDGVTAAYDTGVALTFTQNYATLAALKAASLSVGQFATCNALGFLRTGTRPSSLTVDAFVGATVAARSAARIARSMIPAGVPVSEADFDALHAANPAECEFYTGTRETDTLAAIQQVLASIGAGIYVDRLNVVRVERLALPTGGEVVLDEGLLPDLNGDPVIDERIGLMRDNAFNREAPQDEGEGVPATQVTVRWGRAYTTYTEKDLAGTNSTEAYRSFATQDMRQAVVTSAANEAIHPDGPELVFDTCLCRREDAEAEAARLMAIYGARRDFFSVSVKAEFVPSLDLGDVVRLAPARFGMREAGGVPARVTGLVQTYAQGVTEIEVWR